MRSGGGGDFTGNAAQTLFYELFEGPSGAVTGQHGKVVQVDICVAVGVGDLVIIDFREPVVGGDRTGV